MKDKTPLISALSDAMGAPIMEKASPQDVARFASNILAELHCSFLGDSDSQSDARVASLTVLGFVARLLDSHLAAERYEYEGPHVYQNWLSEQDRDLSTLAKNETEAVRNAVTRLRLDFQSSLKVSGGAQALADQLSALTLAIFITYPVRDSELSQYCSTQKALFQIIKAFQTRV